MKKRVFITGGSGFVGANLVQKQLVKTMRFIYSGTYRKITHGKQSVVW